MAESVTSVDMQSLGRSRFRVWPLHVHEFKRTLGLANIAEQAFAKVGDSRVIDIRGEWVDVARGCIPLMSFYGGEKGVSWQFPEHCDTFILYREEHT